MKRFDGREATLALAGAKIVEPVRTSDREGWKSASADFSRNPTVVYLLFLIGLAGLYAEFNHPGTWVPGLVGAVALILFAFSAQQLPISAIGLAARAASDSRCSCSSSRSRRTACSASPERSPSSRAP